MTAREDVLLDEVIRLREALDTTTKALHLAWSEVRRARERAAELEGQLAMMRSTG